MFVNLKHLDENVFVSGARFVKSNNHIVYIADFGYRGHDVSPFGFEGSNMAFCSLPPPCDYYPMLCRAATTCFVGGTPRAI